MRFLTLGSLLAALIAVGVLADDPVVVSNESESYPGFDLVYCWASLSDPRQQSYYGEVPVSVPYQCQHYGYVDTDGPAQEAVTFIVKGKVGDMPTTVYGEVDPPATLVVPEDFNGWKATSVLINNAGNIGKAAGPYTAFGLTSIGRAQDSLPLACEARSEFDVYAE
jgi:hypothetical protein